MLMPILALCGDGEGGSPLELDPEEDADLLAEAPELIPVCVAGMHRFWKEHRGRPTAMSAHTRGRKTKIGRNDPCPAAPAASISAAVALTEQLPRPSSDAYIEVERGAAAHHGWRGGSRDGPRIRSVSPGGDRLIASYRRGVSLSGGLPAAPAPAPAFRAPAATRAGGDQREDRRSITEARWRSASASRSWPCSWYSLARSLSTLPRSGCSGPSAFSRLARARRRSGPASS